MLKADQNTQKAHKLVPEGTHIARCYSIIHIGHIPNTFPGATTPTVNKIRLTWEIPELTEVFREGEEAKPFVISQEFTLSMHEKSNLYKTVCSWVGKKLSETEASEFDVESLVGKPCMLGIAHMTKNDKTFAVVNSVVKLPSSIKCGLQANKSTIISWDNLKVETFNSLPPFIQEKMKSSSEYRHWAQEPSDDYPVNDLEDVPF